ncbi:hypothetical protein GY45DRAFT_1328662 [Cubamyces sp. BRFM 1775]|nr:hypothetical protein GY45DRAFT_1328662 [Cubamyces sp. BRFM 1775]
MDEADPSFVDAPHLQSLEKVQAFLHAAALDEGSPRFSARRIRDRYLCWKREGRLNHIGSSDMTSLISLFGSLSVSSYGEHYTSLHGHRRLKDMPESSFGPHWDMVLGICSDKRWLRRPLSTSDQYWLMRARLARFQEHMERNEIRKAKQYLVAAEKCYLAIRTSSLHPDLHLPYYSALRAASSPDAPDLATHLTAIITVPGYIHPSLRELTYQAILAQDRVTSRSTQELLRAVVSRTSKQQGGISSLQDDSPSPCRKAISSRSIPTSAVGLTMALERTIFTDAWIGQKELRDWSATLAGRIFAAGGDDVHLTDLRWNCLVLLALVRTRSLEWNGQSVEGAKDPVQRAAIMEWQTVCILASIENLVDPSIPSAADALSEEIVQGFCGVLRKLWHDWTTIAASGVSSRPHYVTCLIYASFLKLAGYFKDKTLLDACRHHCNVVDLWLHSESSSGSFDGRLALASEQLYAALVCGAFFERALVDLVVCTTNMRILRGAVDTAVARYSRYDPDHAQELLAWATHRGITPSGKAIARVGVALALHGDSTYVDRYITDTRLSHDERAQVIVAHLRMFATHGLSFMRPRVVADVVSTAIELLGDVSTPQPLPKWVWSALLVLVRQGHASLAMSLVTDLASKHPSRISQAAYTDLFRALLRHRQFKLARRLMVRCAATYPAMVENWKAYAFPHFLRGGAAWTASPSYGSVRRPLRVAASALSRGPQAQTRKGLLTIRLPAVYGSTSTAQRALQLLVRAGRFHAAKKLYERIYRRESPEVRTSCGNIILHGLVCQTSRTARQRARSVAHTYRALAAQYDFAPDRITVNILFKTLLQSKDLDAARARALFDAVLRMGYPGSEGDVAEEGGEAGKQPSGLPTIESVEIPQLESPIMYLRHVRPLFRTFIKTFYLLDDVEAARRAIGILKRMEAGNAWRLAKGTDWVVSEGRVV